MGFLRAAADAAPKLVELGEAKALSVLDDHHGGVGDVDADFHDGGGDEDLGFVFAEALHDFFFFVAGEAAVQEAELELWKNFSRQSLEFFNGSFQLELRFFDDRINDVALVTGGDFAAERLPNAGEMLLGGHARDDGRASGREFIENGNVEVAVESERQRARDGRRRQHENMRGVAMGGGFIHQPLALEDAEAMLLINGDKTKPREFHVVFDQGVRADDELRFARSNALEGRGLLRAFQAADQQFHAIARFGENAPRGEKVLHGENFRWSHERGLRTVFDGDHRRLQRNDGLAAADVALEETIHRGGFFQVRGDFGENALLRRRGLERQDALQRFAHSVFPQTERDGVFLASGLAVQSEAELIHEKFLEDEPLLRRRTKRVQGIEGFAGFWKVRVNQSFAARGIAKPRSQSLRQNIRHPLIDKLHRGVHGAANLPGTECANRFVDRHDSADLGGVHFFIAQHFDLRIDHLQPRGPQLIDLRLAMKNEQLPGLQPTFEIASVVKLARQRTAGVVLHQQVIDGVAAAHAAHRLAAHDARANGIRAVRLNVLHLGEMDAVFIAKGEVAQQILERVDPALREQFGALRAHAFDHAHFGAEIHRH